MSIFIMILLLSLLILVHEVGHFIAARAFGIKVEKKNVSNKQKQKKKIYTETLNLP